MGFLRDNHATPTRMVISAHVFLVVVLAAYVACAWDYVEAYAIVLALASPVWFFMGAHLLEDSSHRSQRVRRNLPENLTTRLLVGMYLPGSATGYLFIAASVAGASLTGIVLLWIWQLARSDVDAISQIRAAAPLFFVTCYTVIYLGLARLLLRWVEKSIPSWRSYRWMIALTPTAVWPLVTVYSLPWLPRMGSAYSSVHALNFLWTTIAALTTPTVIAPAAYLTVGILAVLVLALNLPAVGRDLGQTREITPSRVLEEERSLHPERWTVPPAKHGPWDA